MKIFLSAVLFISTVFRVHALIVSEVMSNPVGDDSGREWIEIYNDSTSDVDLTSMTVSIKGGTAVVTTPLQGGLTLPANGYVIIGSTVSGATKFLQDYPSYSGLLFKSSISLVNTGVTSINIKLNGSVAASLPSYTAAKEGLTLSFVGGGYVSSNPTPGSDNQAADTSTGGTSSTSTATTTDNQVTLPQMAPPSANIVIYMPEEKVVVAGAESIFSVFSMTREGKPLSDLIYTWAFGDGGQATGSSTLYKYVYSGRYIAQVQAINASVSGTGRMIVRVVPPDLSITSVGTGKYGAYVDIKNPNTYDLDLSDWILMLDGAAFSFPKNTLLSAGATTRFSGIAMGFAKMNIATSTLVKIMFPNLEEVTRYVPPQAEAAISVPVPVATAAVTTPKKVEILTKPKMVLGASTTTVSSVTTAAASTSITIPKSATRDTRLISWFKKLFK
jgi:hypothetical protein